MSIDRFMTALFLQGGYNVTLVVIGAALLGAAAGASGAFVFLRRRALVSDAISHATLPGIAIAFLVMLAAGGDGRWLPGLIAGAAVSAAIGLVIVEWMARETRLGEDAAIGAVLSVFFGAGIVLLTVIQGLGRGQAAGLEDFLLGQAAGMLASEALMIAVAGGLSTLAVWALRRPMVLVAFDPAYARATGVDVRRVDLAMMGLALAITVVGLKIVGLILIVAMLIIPPAAARFWTDRVDRLVLGAAVIGGVSAWVGAALSASADGLPTGPVIVLAAFALFAASLVFAPLRGALAAALRHRRFQRAVHRRQGLLALARDEAILDTQTLGILRREGFLRRDGMATDAGRAAAVEARLDEARWQALRARAVAPGGGSVALTTTPGTLVEAGDAIEGLTPLARILTPDQLSRLDAEIGLGRPTGVTGGAP
ncbi:MAG: metal ABC transporter permease [Pseudomonadota bacterium]